MSERSSPYSDMTPYTDRGPDDADADMVGRAEQLSEADQRHTQKVNQVIQVRGDPCRSFALERKNTS